MFEQPQNQQNFFHDTIKANIIKSVNDGSLEKQLECILNKDCKNLDTNDYIMIGNLAYFIGIDFLQADKLKLELIKKFRERFTVLTLNKKCITGFFQVLQNLAPEELEAPKEKMKSLVYEKIVVDNMQELLEIRKLVSSIIKNSTLPVSMAEDVEQLLNTTHYNYSDILKINSLFYKSLNLNGAVIEKSIKLFSSEDFKKHLLIAQQVYDSQKFAIVYIDSILLALEAIAKFGNYWYWLGVPEEELEQEFEMSAAKVIEQPVVEEKVVDSKEFESPSAEEITKLAENNTDQMILGVCEESLGKKVETPEELMEAIKHLMANTDLIQDIYKYIKAKTNDNRQPLEELIPGFNMEAFSILLADELQKRTDKYKNLVQLITREIPVNVITRIVLYVNDTIKALNIIGDTRKGYLLTQIAENQISTYNHLQQILNVIEECDIYGDKLNNYTILVRFLKEQTDCVKIFEESLKVEEEQIAISFLTGIREFYFKDEVAAEDTKSTEAEVPEQ